jgi:hypothetical protein
MMGPLSVEGLTWLGGETKNISAKALTANILCTRHNAALSGLDSSAGQFYRELVDVGQYLRRGAAATRVRLFSGNDIELWLLKVLCRLAAAGVAEHFAGDAAPPNWDTWSRALFGELFLPPHVGLHSYVPLQHTALATHKLRAALVSNMDGIYGLTMDIRDKMFLFSLAPPRTLRPLNLCAKRSRPTLPSRAATSRSTPSEEVAVAEGDLAFHGFVRLLIRTTSADPSNAL